MNDEFPPVTITSTDTPPGSPPLRSEVSRLREERDSLAKRVEELKKVLLQVATENDQHKFENGIGFLRAATADRIDRLLSGGEG